MSLASLGKMIMQEQASDIPISYSRVSASEVFLGVCWGEMLLIWLLGVGTWEILIRH